MPPRYPPLGRWTAELPRVQLHGAVRDPLDAAQLVGRLERGAVGDPGSGRHLRDVGGQHLQPVYREAQRGVPAVEEPHPLLVEVPVVSGVIDLPEQAVDDVLATVLQHGVRAVGGTARVGELLPVAGSQRGAFPVAVVPGDHRVGGRQLEPHRMVVVEVGADQLVFERDAPARREPGVRLAAWRPSGRRGHRSPARGAAVTADGSPASRQTASSSVSCRTPANDDITTSSSPGNRMAEPVAASSPARDSRQTRGDSTRRYAPSSWTSTCVFSSSMTETTDHANGVACSTGPTPSTPRAPEVLIRPPLYPRRFPRRRVAPGSDAGTRWPGSARGRSAHRIPTRARHRSGRRHRRRPRRADWQGAGTGSRRRPASRRGCTAGRQWLRGSRRAFRPPRCRPASRRTATPPRCRHLRSTLKMSPFPSPAWAMVAAGSRMSPASLRTVTDPSCSGARPQATSWPASCATVRSSGVTMTRPRKSSLAKPNR